jgi:hypothetical protein
MIKRLVLRLAFGAALTFAPVAEADAPKGITTAQDLFDTCADPSPISQAVCDTYVHATIQAAEIIHGADNGGKMTPLFCPGDNMVAQDLVAILRLQVAAHPERKDFPAPAVIIGGGVDAYPCPKTAATPAAKPGPAPAHRPRTRRAHR